MFKKRGVEESSPFFRRQKWLMAVATLIGTIVGAGILGIPYVIAKAGFWYGSLLILSIGLAFICLNLFAGEFVLRTKQQHQLTGYAEKYLGKNGKRIMTLSMVFNIYGALTAYLIGEGASLHSIFGFGQPLLYTLLFFIVGSLIVYYGIKATGRVELILICLLLLVVLGIGIFSYDKINWNHLSSFNPAFFFLPYGVILFAFMASPAIPEVQEVLGKDKKKMKSVILIGSSIPIILYLLFAFVIVGIIGVDNFNLLEENQRIATIALGIFSYPLLGLFANLLAIFSMFTSFLTLSTALIEMYHYDYHFSRNVAIFLTFLFPIGVILLNLTTFIAVLGLTGALAGGLDGIMVTLMYWRAKRHGDRTPEYSLPPHKIIGSLLILLFALGIFYQLWFTFF